MPRMSPLLRMTNSLRLPLLLFSIPYTYLWLEQAPGIGWAVAMAHAALLLFYATHFDLAVLRTGDEPRLSLTREREAHSPGIIEPARLFIGLIAGVCSIVLLFFDWRLGVIGVGALGLILLLTRGLRSANARRKFIFAELIWPLVVLIAPMWFVSSTSWHAAPAEPDVVATNPVHAVIMPVADEPVAEDEPVADAPEDAEPTEQPDDEAERAVVPVSEPLSDSVIGATWIGATLLSAYIALCLLRDEIPDRSLGLRTIATSAGRAGALAWILLMMTAGILIAAWGGQTHWHWLLTPTLAITAMAVLLLLAQRMDDHAVCMLWAGHTVAAVIMLASVPVPV